MHLYPLHGSINGKQLVMFILNIKWYLPVLRFRFFCIQYTYYLIIRKLNIVYTLQMKGEEINSVAINLSLINYLNTLKPNVATENHLYLSDSTIPIYT